MSYPVYYVPAGDVLPVMFSSYAGATGASVTMTGLAVTDVEIYKDGGVTQRASDAGYTLLDTDGIDFDGITGIHGFSIDTGDNTDAGFYTVGAWFTVVVSAITIDSQTVNFIAAQFRIMAAEGVAGVPDVNTTHISDTAQTAKDVGAALPAAASGAAGGLPVIGTGANNFKSDASANVTFANTSIATVTNLTNLPAITAGWLTAAGIAAGALDGKGDWNIGKTGYALSATGSAALTEGYAADGATGTLPQLLYMILSLLSEKSITGTTLTAKKLDGTTTAGTFTLDDATTPTSITRAT